MEKRRIMDFFEVINKRKAVRKYIGGRTIPQKDIDNILETISLAPSAKNLQSFKIFIAKGAKRVAKLFPVYFNQRSDFIKHASLIMVFCKDPEEAYEVFGERGKNLYSLQDATIAAIYAILSAVALGYSTCWVGNFETQEMKRVLNTRLEPVVSIIIGYPDEDPQRKPRKSKDDLVSYIS